MDKHDFSARRRVWGGAMKGLMVLCAVLTCALAAFLILYVLAKGIPNLSWKLLTTKPSYLEETIGILPDILAGNIIGILAQRLVRRLCPVCREARPAHNYELRLLALPDLTEPPLLHHPKGCPHCDFQGYRGRLAIMELLRLDPDLDEAMRACVRSALSLIQARWGLDEHLAYAYLSAATDFNISQVVDIVCGVHARIRESDFKAVNHDECF